MRWAAVARAGYVFGKGDVEVDFDAVVSRAGAQEIDDFIHHRIAAAPVDQPVGGRERAGVDQRIARDALLAFELDDRIERRSRRLAPDAIPQRTADAAQRERQREDLRHRLDREWVVSRSEEHTSELQSLMRI